MSKVIRSISKTSVCTQVLAVCLNKFFRAVYRAPFWKKF